MENRNIYKMDDVLLALSVLLLLPLGYFAWPWLSQLPNAEDPVLFLTMAPVVLGPRLVTVIMYALGALSAQIGGRYVRFQEKQSLAILDEIGFNRKVRFQEIASRLGMSEAHVRKLITKLCRLTSLNLQSEGDRVSRSRHPVQPTVRETKQYSPIDQADLKDELKKSVNQRIPTVQTGEAETGKKGKLPVLFLIILFFTPLWPLALFLIIRSAMKNAALENKE